MAITIGLVEEHSGLEKSLNTSSAHIKNSKIIWSCSSVEGSVE